MFRGEEAAHLGLRLRTAGGNPGADGQDAGVRAGKFVRIFFGLDSFILKNKSLFVNFKNYMKVIWT
jgi:hypothetical protein